MKPLIFLSWMIFATFGLRAQQPLPHHPFTLRGRVNGMFTRQVCLSYKNWDGVRISDTCKVVQGRFTFSGILIEPCLATLKGFNQRPALNGKNSVDFFLEPENMTATVTENRYNQAVFTGSKTQQAFELYQQREALLHKETDACNAQYDQIAASLEKMTDQHLKDRKINQMEQLKKKLNTLNHQSELLSYHTILQQPQTILSAYLLALNHYKLTLDSLKMFWNHLADPVKNSYYGLLMKVTIGQNENTLPGALAPDFTTREITGSPLTLSSFRGKSVVLLNFWASWCTYCRAELPHLKDLYQKYHHKGFEIIAVSTDTDFVLWKAAIQSDSTESWHHVPVVQDPTTPFNFHPSVDDLRIHYPFAPIPLQVLIDQKGVVVAKWIGGSETNQQELDQKLQALLNN